MMQFGVFFFLLCIFFILLGRKKIVGGFWEPLGERVDFGSDVTKPTCESTMNSWDPI